MKCLSALQASLLILLLSGALIPSRAAISMAPACMATIRPLETRGGSYRAALELSGACLRDTVIRVRKSSTLNQRTLGAPYQPIRPDGSPRYNRLYSWTLTPKGSNVPASELWTLFTWQWQAYVPSERSLTNSGWRPLPVVVQP